jgi:hypothetical protein
MGFQHGATDALEAPLIGLRGIGESHVNIRCRLYREERDVLPGKDFVVEVWDRNSTPDEDEDLPQGELIAECVGNSPSEVREKVDNILRQHNYPLTGSWKLRGSL